MNVYGITVPVHRKGTPAEPLSQPDEDAEVENRSNCKEGAVEVTLLMLKDDVFANCPSPWENTGGIHPSPENPRILTVLPGEKQEGKKDDPEPFDSSRAMFQLPANNHRPARIKDIENHDEEEHPDSHRIPIAEAQKPPVEGARVTALPRQKKTDSGDHQADQANREGDEWVIPPVLWGRQLYWSRARHGRLRIHRPSSPLRLTGTSSMVAYCERCKALR